MLGSTSVLASGRFHGEGWYRVVSWLCGVELGSRGYRNGWDGSDGKFLWLINVDLFRVEIESLCMQV